jgi:RNA polymerase sigma-70 factor (ECF subfamily)
MADESEKLQIFNEHRPRLFGLAYRMLGTRDDAEDIVQETYVRWHKTETDGIETPEAWLVAVATRLSIDRLRKASVQRETYIGPWLPEPIVFDSKSSPELQAEMAADVSLAFLVLLERLSPLERAIFLLHEVFDFAHAEIAKIVEKSETAVRQIVSRARTRVRNDRPRFKADDASRLDLIRKFVTAAYSNDEGTILSIFADDIALTSDGGGKVNAARRTIYGSKRLARLYTITPPKYPGSLQAVVVTINGEPGLIEFLDGQPVAATTFVFNGDMIKALYRVMNPDKLQRISPIEKKNAIGLSHN